MNSKISTTTEYKYEIKLFQRSNPTKIRFFLNFNSLFVILNSSQFRIEIQKALQTLEQ